MDLRSRRQSPGGVRVTVFALEGNAIAGIVGFADAAVFERFELPLEMED